MVVREFANSCENTLILNITMYYGNKPKMLTSIMDNRMTMVNMTNHAHCPSSISSQVFLRINAFPFLSLASISINLGVKCI